MTLSRGLYDLVLTQAVARSLGAIAPDVADLRDLDTEEAAERLIEVLGRQLRGLLDHLGAGHDEQVRSQLELVNGLLAQLRAERRETGDLVDPVENPPRILRAIHGPAEPAPTAPETGLAAPWLFTAGRGSPSLLTELRREAAAC